MGQNQFFEYTSQKEIRYNTHQPEACITVEAGTDALVMHLCQETAPENQKFILQEEKEKGREQKTCWLKRGKRSHQHCPPLELPVPLTLSEVLACVRQPGGTLALSRHGLAPRPGMDLVPLQHQWLISLSDIFVS
ncbi:polypeptide N-acetylgalactosaminyltransferase 12-like isoform X1 [Leptonychotes weddellii]|uniref:Polypeptide N-acetylgalactosaminyltransferase 12-like isoform X1 n=1 Tax=Leptonychotes weddellii TaxID=9713 RepID=A0A7F8Q3H1_LEPWE|nr:polypeptide N-acetylgalactosaminyltransferase 12-like isoform X1 [Leptonychotes weddellii]